MFSFIYLTIYCTDVINIFTSLFVVYLIRIWDSSVSIVNRSQAGFESQDC